MIELTQLNGDPLILNCRLIETIENIPETKITITTGKYYLVKESQEEIVQRIISFERMVRKGMISLKQREKAEKEKPPKDKTEKKEPKTEETKETEEEKAEKEE